jgi:hypothetical protein
MPLRERNDLEPLEPLPAAFVNAQQEFIGASAINFAVRIKATDNTVLQVLAGPDNDRAAIGIQGRWRWVESAVERASIGGVARTLDVYVTAAESNYVAGSPGEVDDTDRSFGLALVEHDAAAPTGVDLARKVAEVAWDGSRFTVINPVVGGDTGGLRPRDTLSAVETDLKVIRGRVSGSATVMKGAGFTVTRTPLGFAAGDYTVAFDAPFSDEPTVDPTPIFAGGNIGWRLVSVANGSFRLITWDSAGAQVNSDFGFIAIGPA